MASYPYARVAHLLNIPRESLPAHMTCPYCHASTSTPTTLTGDPQSLRSYELTIAYRVEDAWFIYDESNSPTTNRHVRAVRAVLESQGYRATDETETLRRGFNRHDVYRRYQKES